MAEAFIGEIRFFSFNYAPNGWATCDGQTLPINQNQALFALIGTIYGGDGISNFKLPDFRGRVMTHRNLSDPNFQEGQPGGNEGVALTSTAQLPQHSHALLANSAAGTVNTPQGNVPAAVATSGSFAYSATKAPPNILAPGSLAPAGGSVPHNNMQPSLVINYCIALTGYFPPRS